MLIWGSGDRPTAPDDDHPLKREATWLHEALFRKAETSSDAKEEKVGAFFAPARLGHAAPFSGGELKLLYAWLAREAIGPLQGEVGAERSPVELHVVSASGRFGFLERADVAEALRKAVEAGVRLTVHCPERPEVRKKVREALGGDAAAETVLLATCGPGPGPIEFNCMNLNGSGTAGAGGGTLYAIRPALISETGDSDDVEPVGIRLRDEERRSFENWLPSKSSDSARHPSLQTSPRDNPSTDGIEREAGTSAG
jgi:hypothetical protein